MQPLTPTAEPALETYRDVSRAAVAALLLGLASPLVLASPLLAIVPLGAICLSVVALRGIWASEGQLVGRWPAVIGLCLATFSLGVGLSWTLSRQAHVQTQATKFADQWLALLASGNQQQAHQLKLSQRERVTDPQALDSYYKARVEASKDLQQMATSDALATFILQGRSVAFRRRGIASQQHAGQKDQVVLEYEYDRVKMEPQHLWITVERELAEEGSADWRIGYVGTFDPNSSGT